MSRAGRTAAALLSYAAVACVPFTCLAQTPPDAGSTLREMERRQLAPPPPAPPAPRGPQAAPAEMTAASTVRFLLKEVRISGNTVFKTATLSGLLRDLIGSEIGFEELSGAAASITRHYRAHGYLLARAYLPQQEIRDGVVEIAVLEVRHGKTEIENRSRVADDVVARYTRPLAGRIIEQGVLERRLLLVYDLSGVAESESEFTPGERSGESDLVIRLGRSAAIAGSIELDNHGNRYSGANRVSASVQALSPTGFGDQITARFTKGDPGLEYWRLGYQLPIGGDGLQFGVAYSESSYKLGKEFDALDASGRTVAPSVNMAYPFVRSRPFNVYGRANYERRDIRDSAGAAATVTDKSIEALSLSVTTDFRGPASDLTMVSVGYASGKLNIETPLAQAIDALTARAQGGFGKLTLDMLRLHPVGERLTLAVSLAAQKATKNLDSSEKFALGGASGVRAYPAGEGPGDSGYLLRAELRRGLYRPSLPGTIERFIFVDTGNVKTNEQQFLLGSSNNQQLSALGVGASWELRGDFRVQFSIAHKLGNAAATAGNDAKLRGWAQVIKYF